MSAEMDRTLVDVATRWQEVIATFVGDDAGRSVLLAGVDDLVSCEVGSAMDTPRPGASVLKLAVALAALDAGRDGTINLDRPVDLSEIGPSRWPSLLDIFMAGRSLTVAELIGLSLSVSDNRSANHVITLVGMDRVNRHSVSLGCTGTSLRVGFSDDVLNERGRANETTTRDSARLLRLVAQQPELGMIRRALQASPSYARIPLYLPDDVIVAHKTGSLFGVVNDVGIVGAASGDFIACFLCDAQSDPARTAIDIGICANSALEAWEVR